MLRKSLILLILSVLDGHRTTAFFLQSHKVVNIIQPHKRTIRILRSSNDDEPSEDDIKRLNALLRGGGGSVGNLNTPNVNDAVERKRPPGKLGINDDNVPETQQPAQELEDLKAAPLFKWAQFDDTAFLQELGKTYAGVFLFISLPISMVTYDIFSAPVQALAAANFGTTAFLCLLLLRLWVGWSYVGDRLIKDVGYYEQTGWYDGFLSVKPADVRDRDKLLYDFEVAPALRRVQRAAAAAVVLSLLSIALLTTVAPDDPYMYLNDDYLQSLRGDDANAAREQAERATSGRPTYCDDRYYRARAGGSGCR
mmetsp:Transcript_23102/g.47235  ORF Transcript_23102/g.47235 Transcript_23102/m.47235 type:complete len:310 (+) Transcript_23102:72-1001(+)